MADFSSFDDLLKFVQGAIEDTMQNEVNEEIRAELSEYVRSDVYDAYTPNVYDRTDALLDDIQGVAVSVGDTTILTVTDDVYQTGVNRDQVYITDIVEYGHWKSQLGYEFPFVGNGELGDYVYPRPFIEDTIDNLEGTGIVPYTLMKGLQKRGMDVL